MGTVLSAMRNDDGEWKRDQQQQQSNDLHSSKRKEMGVLKEWKSPFTMVRSTVYTIAGQAPANCRLSLQRRASHRARHEMGVDSHRSNVLLCFDCDW